MLKSYKINALILVIIIYGFTLFLNDGFMALDEYWVGITRYIPAQSSSIQSLVTPDDVKSPLQLMPMHIFAQTALQLGFDQPYAQYRFVIYFLGLINLLLIIAAFYLYIDERKLDDKKAGILFLMLAFYFAAPFSLTRPMFESMAAPWLALAGVFAIRYDRQQKKSDLLWGVSAASMAFVLRQQLGLCALVFVILPLLKKNMRDLLKVAALGGFYFILSGIPDFYLRGKFHFSLLNLVFYNFEHGGDYGHQPITFYPLLIFVVTLMPFFIYKYNIDFLRKTLKEDRSLWMIVFLFVFLHSLFPQKWERFVISLIPLFVLMAYPYFLNMWSDLQKRKVRIIALLSFNGFLFVVVSFFPPQKNLIEMSLFINKHPEIKRIYRINNTPEWITDAFIVQKQYEFIDVEASALPTVDWSDCANALVVGNGKESQIDQGVFSKLQLRETFKPNLIEQWSYNLNPQKNLRRVSLNMYTCQHSP